MGRTDVPEVEQSLRQLGTDALLRLWQAADLEEARARTRPLLTPAVTRPHSKATLPRLFSYLKPHRRYVAGITAALVASAAADLAQPLIVGIMLFQQVIFQRELGLLPWVLALLAMTFAIKMTCDFLKDYLSEVLSQKTVHRLRSEVYQHIELLPVPVFDKSRTGELISRVVNDTNEIEKILSDDVANFVENGVMVAGALGLIFFVDARLAVIVAPVAIVLAVIVNLFKRAIKRASRKIREAVAELTAKAFEVVSGIHIVKSFRMEDHEARAFYDRSLGIAKAKIRLARLAGAYSSTVNLLTAFAVMVLIWLATPEVVAGALTPGALVAFLAYMDKIFKPLIQLSKVNLAVQKAAAAADRIFEVIDTEPEKLEASDGLAPPTLDGRIEFDRVSFRYRPNRNVLEDFSLVIEPGETVAVVGSSGAGKSTIVSLLLRFYEPTSGRIRIDQYPIGRLKLGYLRRKIGLVLQEPLLFSGTIRENIKYGNTEASEEDIVKAAQSANAHDFIASLPKGYDSQIGERGVTLSVGQRQRIAIARALLKDPSILILDEATSNIDSESESLIQEALRRMARRRTIIVIGHRLSSIMDADRIVVLEDGGIAEVGTHADLLEKGGTYTRLYEAQIDRGPPREATHHEIA